MIDHLAAEGLGGLAAIASRRGDLDRAAQLLGAATICGPVGDADVLAHLETQFFAPARRQHGTRRWNDAHTAGAEMTFEQAIAYALTPGPAGSERSTHRPEVHSGSEQRGDAGPALRARRRSAGS